MRPPVHPEAEGAVHESELGVTGAYDPYLRVKQVGVTGAQRGLLSTSAASPIQASEGSVATPDRPMRYCCFS